MKHTSLDTRMKEFYEQRAESYLTRRTPVILRIDGRAFHTLTKNFERPYDKVFHRAMHRTMKYLCENIQGAKLGYTQSDEISLLLIDYDTFETSAWFDYRVQKICSIAASMATMVFNRFFAQEVENSYSLRYTKALQMGAMFDCRCFNLPKEEVTNYFISRQQDATRNAIQMLGQTHFLHSELHGKSCNDIQDMLFTQKGINFNDMAIAFKRGVCCKRIEGNWIVDIDVPVFTQDREYIEVLIHTEIGQLPPPTLH